jgi:hypothetical protein
VVVDKADSFMHSAEPQPTTNASGHPFLALRSLAFCVRAFAAAREALVAIALRSSGVNDFARASPPRLAMVDRYLEMADLPILGI